MKGLYEDRPVRRDGRSCQSLLCKKFLLIGIMGVSAVLLPLYLLAGYAKHRYLSLIRTLFAEGP